MTNEEMSSKLSALEERTQSNIRRIEKLELANEALTSLATSVELLVQEQKHQTKAMLDIKTDVATLDGKVEALEKKPVKKWDKLGETILTLLVGAVMALVLGKIGLG